jgi:hypothetical protein
MALHTSSVHFEGHRAADMAPLLERLDYRLVGPPAKVQTADAAAELLDADTGSRNIVRKAVYESGEWTFLYDPEMVVFTNDAMLSLYAREKGTRIFAWICEGVSRTYGFKLFAPDLVRDVLAVGGEVLTNDGVALPQEGGVNWTSCSEREVMRIADRFGAAFDGFSRDRTYEILTLDESHMPTPDLSGVSMEMPFRPEDLVVRVVKRPWWKIW